MEKGHQSFWTMRFFRPIVQDMKGDAPAVRTVKKSKETVYRLLEVIRERPGFYLHTPTLVDCLISNLT
jgi:hypothetical protein